MRRNWQVSSWNIKNSVLASPVLFSLFWLHQGCAWNFHFLTVAEGQAPKKKKFFQCRIGDIKQHGRGSRGLHWDWWKNKLYLAFFVCVCLFSWLVGLNLIHLFISLFVCYNSNKRTKTSRVTIKNPWVVVKSSVGCRYVIHRINLWH